MGASSFQVIVKIKDGEAKSEQAAFNEAVREAQYDSGHGGYTGTIAEKRSFTRVGSVATEAEGWALVNALFEKNDSRIDDKWGPAGSIKVGADAFIFFGYASS